MLISAITPTRGRPERLPGLVELFLAQTHADKELVILDDSEEPCAALTGALPAGVRYHHRPERMTLGDKRNALCKLAAGEVIAHFDDDDLYAPRYLARMLELLGDADALKLDAWFVWSEPQRALYYWDTRDEAPYFFDAQVRPPQPWYFGDDRGQRWTQDNVHGYGFSFVYRRALAEHAPFDAVDFAEENALFAKARAAGLRCAHAADEEGLAVHVLHEANTSWAFPQYRLPGWALPRLFGDCARLLR